jgi:hypothetical protein
MRHGVSEVRSKKLAQDLRDLGTCGDDELKERWRSFYGTEPPGKIHRSLLIQAIAYRVQQNSASCVYAALLRGISQVMLEPPPHLGRNLAAGAPKTLSSA